MKVLALLALAASLLTAGAAQAQYPDKPVRIIVPFIAGSAPDVAARQVAQRLTASLGQQFVVDNKPGVAGNIGAEVAARAAPDGYSLMLMTSSHVLSPLLYAKVNFDPLKDFVPVTMITRIPSLMVVPPSSPAKIGHGVRGARQVDARQAELRLGWRRQPGASVGRGFPVGGGDRLHPRALQGRAGHRAGAAQQAGRRRLPDHADRLSPGPAGHLARPGGDQRQAHQGDAGSADPAGSDAQWLRARRLACAGSAGRHATGDRRRASTPSWPRA